MLRRRIFVDLDGVMVDFDGHHRATIGPVPDRSDPLVDIDWARIAEMDFFAEAPPMADAFHLWGYLAKYRPTILSGCPKTGTSRAATGKLQWVRKHLGRHVELITCESKHKSEYASAGDILIDDWEKYSAIWTAKGGLWITHTSAVSTIEKLNRIGL